MSSDADRLWDELAPKFRRRKDLCPMTPEEGEEAFKTAPKAPMSKEQIRAIVQNVVNRTPPAMDPLEPEWCEEEDFEEIDAELQLLYRNEGQPDPESEEAERELREQMLNDDEDGMEGTPKTP